MAKISIITVTYNAISSIETTIKSIINQSYTDYEYIIIDGKSTDGTLDIIKKYSPYINKFISEPDKGLYDAMNKGIDLATGEWIFFLNSGDIFTNNSVLSEIFEKKDYQSDILYGDATEISPTGKQTKRSKIISSNLPPDYRHGASFVRASVHKKNKFDLNKIDIIGYALDYHCIYNLYVNGYTFERINTNIIIYEKEGISNHPLKNKWYRAIINNNCNINFRTYISFIKAVAIGSLRKITFIKSIILSTYWFFTDYVMNHIFSHSPIWYIRKMYLLICGGKIKRRSQIDMNCTIMDAYKLHIGEHTHINRNCLLDARGTIEIGNNVSISQRVTLVTGSHDMNSPDFAYINDSIIIKDYVWIGINATILGGVKIGEGAVICAGAVVCKDIEPYTVVAGIPAKKIGKRSNDLSYKPLDKEYFWPMFT